MAYEPLRESSAHADNTARAQAPEEAVLDQYLEKPAPLRDWLEARIRRAPWWCISFLVHVIALLILWSWPVERLIEAQVPFEMPPVGLVPPDPEPERPKDTAKPPEDPPLPKDFEITNDIRDRSGERVLDEVKAPDEVPHGVDLPDEFQQTPDHSLPIIALVNHVPFVDIGPSRKGDPYSKRREIESFIDGPIGPPKRPELTPLLAAFVWLAQAQDRDGSWDAQRWDGAKPFRVGMTGLAVLAYEGAGFTHKKGKFSGVVGRALEWLRRNQRENGSFPWETFYEQGIATMAVCEAYGMTEDPRLRAMAQRAVDYIVKLQPDHGGYRYTGPVAKDQGDLSVTGWQIMAIKSAILADLRVPPQGVERSREFLKNSARDYGASAYLVGNAEAGSLAISAIGLLCRIFLSEQGEYEAEIRQAAEYLLARERKDLTPPVGGTSRQLVYDLYYTYYSSLAMAQLEGEYWRAWKQMHLEPLIGAQVHDRADARGRFIKGSWDPAKHKWGKQGGRVYATAIAALCLEAPYRYLATSRWRR